MKKRDSLEIKLYKLLGIRLFRKMVFSLERLIHRKDKGRNINYHIAYNDLESLDAFIKYLFYNGSIHVRNIIIISFYFIVRLVLRNHFMWFDWIITTFLLKDIYCVMLQRYNYLRIIQRKNILEEKNRRIIQREAQRIDISSIENYSSEERYQDLQLVRRLKEAISAHTSIVLNDSDTESLIRLAQIYEKRKTVVLTGKSVTSMTQTEQ